MRIRTFLLAAIVVTVGCASGANNLRSGGITPQELLDGASFGLTEAAAPGPATPEQVLALSPEMRAFLAANVNPRSSDSLKLRQLVGAIFDPATFGLQYDERTRTAAETFRTRRGNCLSFSTMFVAMAREVGLRASYQEVDIPPDWSLDKDTLVLNRHVNVRLVIEPTGTLVVDFNVADFRASYDMREISDLEAMWQFANNVGVEHMQAGDTAVALASFRAAIEGSNGRFSPAWTNLGTLYLRHGDLARAEAAYRQALRADRWNLVAMSNLAYLAERMGDPQRAARYRKRVARYRWHNPYYRYELAKQALAASELDAAIGHLRYAIRQKPGEDRFYDLLATCYERQGDQRAARRWRERAREVAASHALQDAYPGQSALPHDR